MGQHDLEAVKVSQVLAQFDASKLLGNFSFSELGFDTTFSPNLGEDLGTGTTGHSDLERSQGSTTNGVGLTRDSWALDEDTVQVDNFQDASKLTSEFTFSQEDNAADFNKAIESLVVWERKMVTRRESKRLEIMFINVQ